MSGYQVEKQLVLNYYQELDTASKSNITKVMERHLDNHYIWRGFHPFNEQTSAKAVSELFGSHYAMLFDICNVVWIFSWRVRMK